MAFLQHFQNWPKERMICVHAEGQTTAAVILLAELYKRPVHVCHVARKEEVSGPAAMLAPALKFISHMIIM